MISNQRCAEIFVICVVKLVKLTLRNFLRIRFKNLHSLLDFGKQFNLMFLENLQSYHLYFYCSI